VLKLQYMHAMLQGLLELEWAPSRRLSAEVNMKTK